MTSYLPAGAPDERLTTEQLLAAVAREAGYRPSDRQLRYWVASGLLAKPDQKSLGRGRGSVALWEAETLPRLALILRAHSRPVGRNIALESASLLLVLKGYAPVEPHTRPLRDILWDYLHGLDEDASRARPTVMRGLDALDHPTRRLARALAADPLAAVAVQFLRPQLTLMLPDRDAPDPWRRLGWYFSPEGFRAALASTGDAELRGAYAATGAFLDNETGLADMGVVGPLVALMPWMAQVPDLPPRLRARAPGDVHLSAADLRRIPATLAILVWHHYRSEIAETLEAAGRQLATVAHTVAERLAGAGEVEREGSATSPATPSDADAPRGEVAAVQG